LRVRRPAARIGVGVSSPRRDDPAAALNQVLSEVIDGVLDVKQAHRRVPETHALHAVLDQLFYDLRTWARLLADQNRALGVSPLASMPTAAGRTPPHPWHGAASDEEVRRVVGEDLDRRFPGGAAGAGEGIHRTHPGRTRHCRRRLHFRAPRHYVDAR